MKIKKKLSCNNIVSYSISASYNKQTINHVVAQFFLVLVKIVKVHCVAKISVCRSLCLKDRKKTLRLKVTAKSCVKGEIFELKKKKHSHH